MDELLLTVGEKVTVTGVIGEYVSEGEDCGDCSVTQMRLASTSDLVLDGMTDKPAPAPVTVTELESAATAEPWESVVVAVDSPEIMMNEEGDRYIGSSLMIGDAFMHSDDLRAGDKLERLVGVLGSGQPICSSATRGRIWSRRERGCSCAAERCASALVAGAWSLVKSPSRMVWRFPRSRWRVH